MFDNPLIITQLADDTTVFLKNKEKIPIVVNKIKFFSRASGLYLNLKKCELMSIHDDQTNSVYGIPVKEEVKYLGVIITKDNKAREELNILPVIKKSKSILNISY